ncbi:MAG: hypothetical protein RLZZ393_1961 [Pseudomonadota bacterium]
MNIRAPLGVSLALIAALCGLSLWAWGQVPAGQSIAIHFDLDGTPNGYAGKAQGLFALPVIAAVITVFMALVPGMEPRREHLAQNAGLYYTAWFGPLLLLAVGHLAIVGLALGYEFHALRTVPLVLGVLWVVLGAQLGRSQSTFFIGIRTPWTLSSDEVWRRTHRLGGRLFLATGAATLLCGFAPDSRVPLSVLIAGTVITGVTSVVASYVYWRRRA